MKAKLVSISVLVLVGIVSAESVLGHKNRSLKNKQAVQLSHHDSNMDSKFVLLEDHLNDTDDIPNGFDPVLTQLADHLNDTDDIPDDMDPVFIQTSQRVKLADHENDTDDIPSGMDPVLLQISQKNTANDHQNDTEDIADGLEPQDLHLRDQDGGWLNPNQVLADQKKKKEEAAKWNSLYDQEDDEKSYELVQFNHENDSEDIPEGQNPYNVGGVESLLLTRQAWQNDMDRIRFGGKRIGELVQLQSGFDQQNVQLGYDHHTNDTDDLVTDFTPTTYDLKHSKRWNKMVEVQTKAMEKQIQAEDLKEAQDKQAKFEQEQYQNEMARQQFEEQKRREDMLKPNRKAAFKKTNPTEPSKTINFSELYDGIESIDSAPQAYQV